MKKLHVVGYSVMVGMLLATLIGYSRQNAKLMLEQQELRHRLNWIENSAQRLARGEGTLAIYSMTGADELLSCFATRADIDTVSLGMTDVGPAGIRSIASMSNVRWVTFSGDLGVNDETLPLLADCKKLAALDLTCTKVRYTHLAEPDDVTPHCGLSLKNDERGDGRHSRMNDSGRERAGDVLH